MQVSLIDDPRGHRVDSGDNSMLANYVDRATFPGEGYYLPREAGQMLCTLNGGPGDEYPTMRFLCPQSLREQRAPTESMSSDESHGRDRSTSRYYEIRAAEYAEASLRQSMEDALAPFAKRLSHGDTVIDLGCGAGRDLKSLCDRGLRPVGLDASLPLAKLAHDHSGCPIVVGDLRALPFATSIAEAGWASASLLHMSKEDAVVALKEIHRVIKPGGLLFSSVKRGEGCSVDDEGRWFSYYEPDEWRSLLEVAGFSVIESAITKQNVGTLSDGKSVSWISCVGRIMR